MKISPLLSGLLFLTALVAGCATSTPIQRYGESASSFSKPPQLISNSYPAENIYRIYQRGETGFVSISSLRHEVEQRVEEFASRQGKSFVVIGEQISHPPYILGNFPRIEIVFVLLDKSQEGTRTSPDQDKYRQIQTLKKLLDDGAITTEEFEMEKAKVLK